MVTRLAPGSTGAVASPAPAPTPASGSEGRLAALQRTLQQLVGQQVQAAVLSKYSDGSVLIRVQDSAVRVVLPADVNVGAQVPLKVVAVEPRPTFEFNNTAGNASALVYSENLPSGSSALYANLPSQEPLPGAARPAVQPGTPDPAGTAAYAAQAALSSDADAATAASGQAPAADSAAGQAAEGAAAGTGKPGSGAAAGSASGAATGPGAAAGAGAGTGAGAAAEAAEAALANTAPGADSSDSAASGGPAAPGRAGSPSGAAGAMGAPAGAAAQAATQATAGQHSAGLAAAAADAAQASADAAAKATLAANPPPGALAAAVHAKGGKPASLAAQLLEKAPLTPAAELPELDAATPSASLSNTARALTSLLSAVQSPAASLIGKAALFSNGQPDPGQLAQRLSDTIAQSGLFYESHVAQWVKGERSLPELMREPQMQQWQRAAQGGEHAARAASGPDLSAAQMVNQQLHAHEQARLQWQGEAWPGQPMQWEIRREPRDGGQGQGQGEQAEAEPEQVWRSGVHFRFPLLGQLSATVTISGEQVQIQMQADSSQSVQTLRAYASQLEQAMAAAGAPLSSLTISEGGHE